MEKITKKEMYAAIKETFETGTCKFDPSVVMAFCDKEIAALDSKAAKAKERAAAKKAEADALMDKVAAVLSTEDYMTIADIAAAVDDADATISKVTYRLTKLVDAGLAEKTDVTVPGVDGGKSRKVKGFRAVVA